MTDIRIKDGKLTLKNGELIIRSKQLPPAGGPSPTSPQNPAQASASQAKTSAERQKELYERRKAEGWKKIWVDPATMELAERLGGIQMIPQEREEWIAKVEELTRQQPPRPWWRRFLG